MKRILTIFIAAAMIVSSASAMTGCSLKRTSPEDTYSSPLRDNESIDMPLDAHEVEESYSTESAGASKTASKEEKKEESKKEEKKESKAESKANEKKESKSESKAESKAALSESKTESKAESKAESKSESKAAPAESKAESKDATDKDKKDEGSAIYKDMVGLLNDSNVVGYTICKIAGSDDDHLVIAYGSSAKKKTSSMDPNIATDIEEYQRELAAKDAADNDEIELARMYSIYKITDKLAVPEGDIEGFYTTAYISPNTSTLAIYYARNREWRFGLVEINDGSASVNFTNEGDLDSNGGTFPSVPGAEVTFSDPKNFDLLKKYK